MITFKKFIKFVFLAIYQSLFYCLDTLIKSVSKQTVFYVTDKTLGDNIYLFYQYLSQKNENTILLFQDKNLYLNSLKTHPKSLYVKSIKGLFAYFRSECVVVQNGDAKLFFFPLLLNPKTKFILNLWHGIPLKKLNRQVKQYKINRGFFQYQKFSAITVCSEFEKLLMTSCFYADIDSFWITGTPRNDEFFNNTPIPENLREIKGKKNILYTPTWREFGNETSFFPFIDFDLNELNSFLEHHNAHLILRGHRLEINLLQNKFPNLFENSSRIKLANQQEYPNTSDLLKIADVLITDYSSIYLDFLLLEKPIIFLPYDIVEYTKYRGFLFDYESHTPGDKVDSQKDFLTSIEKYFVATDMKIHTEKNLFHKFADDKAKERIYENLKRALKW